MDDAYGDLDTVAAQATADQASTEDRLGTYYSSNTTGILWMIAFSLC